MGLFAVGVEDIIFPPVVQLRDNRSFAECAFIDKDKPGCNHDVAELRRSEGDVSGGDGDVVLLATTVSYSAVMLPGPRRVRPCDNVGDPFLAPEVCPHGLAPG